MNIKILSGYQFPEVTKQLFCEYTNMLVQKNKAVADYLVLQNYDDELANLEEKYGFPNGRLYLAFVDDKPAGCIGLRKFDSMACEMKRLFVRPAFRGVGLAKTLVRKIIDDSKEIGYSVMLLDTLPFLKEAITLYYKFGFYEIERYNNSPMKETIFMQLDL